MKMAGLRGISTRNNPILQACFLGGMVLLYSKFPFFSICILLVFATHPLQTQKCIKNMAAACVLYCQFNILVEFQFSFKYTSDIQSTPKYLSLKCSYTDNRAKEKLEAASLGLP